MYNRSALIKVACMHVWAGTQWHHHLQLQVLHHLRPQEAEDVGGTREVEAYIDGGGSEMR